MILINLNSMDSFSKNSQISNFIKICPVGDELFHGDRWTDVLKLIVAFCNFVKAPKKTLWCVEHISLYKA